MDIRPAEFVRRVNPKEDLGGLIDEAKALTWTLKREHALIVTEADDHVMVRGGADGLSFDVEPDGRVYLDLEGERVRVRNLAWHTHPEPTGPSDHDRAFLRIVGQDHSMIFELRGDPHGTRFSAQKEDQQ